MLLSLFYVLGRNSPNALQLTNLENASRYLSRQDRTNLSLIVLGHLSYIFRQIVQ